MTLVLDTREINVNIWNFTHRETISTKYSIILLAAIKYFSCWEVAIVQREQPTKSQRFVQFILFHSTKQSKPRCIKDKQIQIGVFSKTELGNCNMSNTIFPTSLNHFKYTTKVILRMTFDQNLSPRHRRFKENLMIHWLFGWGWCMQR